MRRPSVVLAALAIVAAPAGWAFLRALLLSPGLTQSGPAAKTIVLQDVLQARLRFRMLADRPSTPTAIARGAPTIMPAMPPFDPAAWPACPAYRVPASASLPAEVHRPYQPGRWLPLEAARSRLLAERLSDLQLAGLAACFAGTPFGGACARWLAEREHFDRADYLRQLLAMQAVALDRGRVCWRVPAITS